MNDRAAVATSREEGILRIILNRPPKKNALNSAMYEALNEALAEAERTPEVRVVLLHGAGGDFTSGNDLEDFARFDPATAEGPVVKFLTRFATMSKPVVAAVEGVAVGIGTTLLLHCDLVYAAQTASFQLPFVRLGLCPENASSLLLPLLAGYQRAAELLLLGEPFSAETAREIGLVNALLPAGETLTKALEQSRKLAALSPVAVQASKALLRRSRKEAVLETIAAELVVFRQRLASPETAEALAAFFRRSHKQ